MWVMLRPFLFAFLEQVFRDCVSYELGHVRSLVCCDFLQVFPLSGCQTDADGRIPSDCHGITPWGVLYSLCRALSTPVIPKRVKFGRTRKNGPRERCSAPGGPVGPRTHPVPPRAVAPLAAGPCAVAVALGACAVAVAQGWRPGLPPPLRGPADRERGWMAPRPPGAVTDTPGHTE